MPFERHEKRKLLVNLLEFFSLFVHLIWILKGSSSFQQFQTGCQILKTAVGTWVFHDRSFNMQRLEMPMRALHHHEQIHLLMQGFECFSSAGDVTIKRDLCKRLKSSHPRETALSVSSWCRSPNCLFCLKLKKGDVYEQLQFWHIGMIWLDSKIILSKV